MYRRVREEENKFEVGKSAIPSHKRKLILFFLILSSEDSVSGDLRETPDMASLL